MYEGGEKVSSRAPVWGSSTCALLGLCGVQFQVVPPCGGISSDGVNSISSVFKSCPRVGGFSERFPQTARHHPVSSRAPVWGHLQPDFSETSHSIGFKSCPRVGGIPWGRPTFFLSLFSSRAPCGGHPMQGSIGGCASFKSCPRVGASSIVGCQRGWRMGFKSCPRVGASENAPQRGCGRHVSSRAPRVGASLLSPVGPPPLLVSSRAPVWGHRPAACSHGLDVASFKSCPRVGASARLK